MATKEDSPTKVDADGAKQEKTCTVLSSDGHTFVLSEYVWKRIPTIRNCVDDLDDSEDVPIPLCEADIGVIKWVNDFYIHHGNPAIMDWTDEHTEEIKLQEYVNKDIETYILKTTTTNLSQPSSDRIPFGRLFNQLNYLDAGEAFDVTAKVFAELVCKHCGDDPVKIKEFLGLVEEPVPA